MHFNPLATRGPRLAQLADPVRPGVSWATRHARAETCTAAAGGVDTDGILIYSPREGRDLCHPLLEKPLEISIHSPLKGRDREGVREINQTTISIHPPLAGRDIFSIADTARLTISIHPPLKG